MPQAPQLHQPSIFAPLRATARTRVLALFFAATWIVGVASLLFIPGVPHWFFYAFIAFTAASLFFAQYPHLALYGMAATYPFLYWQIIFGPINAPVVDVIGVFAVAGLAVRLLIFAMSDKAAFRATHWWGGGLFLAWVAVGIISATQTIVLPVTSSLYYVLRMMSFFYIAYIFFPMNTMRNSKTLHHILRILLGVGVIVAIYGLYSFGVALANPNIPDRAIPVVIFGFAPLGINHNLIADMMVAIIPIGLYLLSQEKNPVIQRFFLLSISLMAMVNMLTFSRTGWLAFVLEMVLLVVFQYRHHIKRFFKYMVLTSLIAFPIIAYMLYFTFTSDIVRSSNQSRLFLNDIALQMFEDHPFIGNGPNAFVYQLSYNKLYTLEYGEPIDAHGFIQKVGSELGILGLLIYNALVIYAIFTAYRAYSRYAKNAQESYLLFCLFLLVCGSIFSQLFQTSYYSPKMWFPIGVALAAASLAKKKESLSI
ncbi:MAG: O-antigen ligase family protein [Candidatus Kerfeldbacteria bacterium]|nr:O-antigen ligase family protein [Candidatus Kerfeldbacteria bacterium]